MKTLWAMIRLDYRNYLLLLTRKTRKPPINNNAITKAKRTSNSNAAPSCEPGLLLATPTERKAMGTKSKRTKAKVASPMTIAQGRFFGVEAGAACGETA